MSGAIGSILTNSGALSALNGIAAAQQANTTYQTELSSGKSINSPADNPAGYIQAQGFTSQLNGITQAMSNANEGVSLLQTAQGAVNQQLSIAQKLNSIAVQAANGTQTAQESQSLQGVVNQLVNQISTVSQQTQFNNINLLDGSFSGIQFQVGANEGQTISLSIGSTAAQDLGMYTAYGNGTSSTPGLYGGSGKGGSGSGTVSATGAFTPTVSGTSQLKISGSNGTGSYNVANANTSAATIASEINAKTNQTNVAAQANTQVTLGVATSGSFSFTLGNGNNGANGVTNGVSINATSVGGLVTAINQQTAKTGVTASIASGGSSKIVLTQSQGKNITVSGFAGTGSLTASKNISGGTAAITLSSGATTSLMVQGKVSLQSDAAFSVSSGKMIGLGNASHIQKLSDINVSTTHGANSAINVIKYAIQGLNNLGGQLGASQQRLQATLNNLTTTSTNLNNGLATVQDANIPQVSQKLTQTQIQAQAGVAALKSSSQLQQAYLSLLP